MIDLHQFRENGEVLIPLLQKKEPNFPIHELLELDASVRSASTQLDELRHKKKQLSATRPVTPESIELSKEVGAQIKQAEEQVAADKKRRDELLLLCPNIPAEDVPHGNKESNVVVRACGPTARPADGAKNHIELNETAKWFDLETAAKMSGGQFVLYTTEGTKIMYALTQLMIANNVKHGFNPMLPPYLVNKQALVNSGNLPKFEGDFYKAEGEDLCLIPTAEVSLTNIHANSIISAEELPKRYTAWTSCFRREAGGYGSAERGLIRIHQFEKVELYSIVKPEDSVSELERMVACAEDMLTQLGLSYRVSLLAGQDCSFSSAKTFDIEVWLPGQNKYYEVSSASNCTDFQARRAGIRYREQQGEKPKLTHTLNASSLALPRLMIALMEQYQQADGTIELPETLRQKLATLW